MSCSRCLAAAVILLATSCASVKVQKVVVGADGVEAATGPDGVRFYMPRPYVVVNEPFVVGSDVYLLRGHLTSDSQYVLVDDADSELLKKLQNYFPTDPNRSLSIPAGKVVVPSAPPVGSLAPPGPQGEGDGGESPKEEKPPSTPGKPEEGQPKKDDQEPEEQPESKPEKKTGVISTKVENDPNAFSLTPLKRYFDIAWLPDFEEQYVARGKAGLGNTSILVRLGQGWSLQGLETTADNSGLTGPLVEVWGDAIKSLYALAKAKYALPAAFTPGPQGAGEVETLSAAAGGIPVTIKLTIAKVAAPGVYPILKEKELACLTEKVERQRAVCLPRPCDYKSELGVLVPVPPFTRVAFNVYELIVLEAAKPSGDSITGIQRYFEFKGGAAGPSPPPGDGGKNDQGKLDHIRDEINRAQNNVADRWEIVSIRPKADGSGKVQVVVKKVGNPNDVKKDLLKNTVVTKSGELGVSLAANRIEVIEEN